MIRHQSRLLLFVVVVVVVVCVHQVLAQATLTEKTIEKYKSLPTLRLANSNIGQVYIEQEQEESSTKLMMPTRIRYSQQTYALEGGLKNKSLFYPLIAVGLYRSIQQTSNVGFAVRMARNINISLAKWKLGISVYSLKRLYDNNGLNNNSPVSSVYDAFEKMLPDELPYGLIVFAFYDATLNRITLQYDLHELKVHHIEGCQNYNVKDRQGKMVGNACALIIQRFIDELN